MANTSIEFHRRNHVMYCVILCKMDDEELLVVKTAEFEMISKSAYLIEQWL